MERLGQIYSKMTKTIGRLLLHLLLAIVALGLFIPLAIIGVVWAIAALSFKARIKDALHRIGDYFWLVAISLDQAGNTFCAELFNDTLIDPRGHRFGDPDETISSVLGKNKQADALTWLGKSLAWILNAIDPNHITKAIEK